MAGVSRSIVVTDAMSAASMGPGRFRIGHLEIEVGNDLVARQPGSPLLAGAAVHMSLAADNLAGQLGLNAEQVHQLTTRNPAAALNLVLSD